MGIFTVMTYNIRHGRGMDDVQDLNRTGLVLQSAEAQLIGLQEVDCHNQRRSHNMDQSQYLAAMLGMQYHFAPALTTPFGYGNAILSSFPLVQSDTLLMPKKGTCEDRSVAVAKVLINERPLMFLSAHLGLVQGERLAHIKIIIDYLAKIDTPVILVGDWNEQPGYPAYEKITETLADVAKACGHEQATFPYLSLYKDEATVRIDFIFISPELEAARVETIQTDASDHLPLIAALRFK